MTKQKDMTMRLGAENAAMAEALNGDRSATDPEAMAQVKAAYEKQSAVVLTRAEQMVLDTAVEQTTSAYSMMCDLLSSVSERDKAAGAMAVIERFLLGLRAAAKESGLPENWVEQVISGLPRGVQLGGGL